MEYIETTQEETTEPVIYMINCINEDYEDATDELQDMGLYVETQFRFDDNVEKDKVCEQSVEAGRVVRKGDTVILYVSKGSEKSPYEYSQKVVVSASSGSSNGKLKLYTWAEGDWQEEFSCTAKVGKEGISSSYGEGIYATPKGTFKLGYLIAPQNMGNASWPFYKATKNTCVVDDSSSPLYNQIKESTNLPKGTGYDSIGSYILSGGCCGVLFIEHNGNGMSDQNVVKGKGSAITICGIEGSLSGTYGCIDISSSNFYTLMSKLDYSKNPYIELTN